MTGRWRVEDEKRFQLTGVTSARSWPRVDKLVEQHEGILAVRGTGSLACNNSLTTFHYVQCHVIL